MGMLIPSLAILPTSNRLAPSTAGIPKMKEKQRRIFAPAWPKPHRNGGAGAGNPGKGAMAWVTLMARVTLALHGCSGFSALTHLSERNRRALVMRKQISPVLCRCQCLKPVFKEYGNQQGQTGPKQKEDHALADTLKGKLSGQKIPQHGKNSLIKPRWCPKSQQYRQQRTQMQHDGEENPCSPLPGKVLNQERCSS